MTLLKRRYHIHDRFDFKNINDIKYYQDNKKRIIQCNLWDTLPSPTINIKIKLHFILKLNKTHYETL